MFLRNFALANESRKSRIANNWSKEDINCNVTSILFVVTILCGAFLHP